MKTEKYVVLMGGKQRSHRCQYIKSGKQCGKGSRKDKPHCYLHENKVVPNLPHVTKQEKQVVDQTTWVKFLQTSVKWMAQNKMMKL